MGSRSRRCARLSARRRSTFFITAAIRSPRPLAPHPLKQALRLADELLVVLEHSLAGIELIDRVLERLGTYNTHGPHRALGLTAPIPAPRPRLVRLGPPDQIHRRDRLGGLIHEYARAA
jgi:hypothetical protein